MYHHAYRELLSSAQTQEIVLEHIDISMSSISTDSNYTMHVASAESDEAWESARELGSISDICRHP